MADRVTLELEGLMLEKLLNRALAGGAQFEHVLRLTRRRISVTAAPGSARILKRLAEQYRIEYRVAALGGLSALIARVCSRITIAAAFMVAIAICALFLSRVWTVEIKLLRGSALPSGTQAVLAEAGIIKGAYIGNIDTETAQLMLVSLDGCAHASVHRRGVAVIAEIACEEPAPGLYAMDDSRDLIAACDGVIASVNVKSGTAMVKPGDTVRKGQVLISGYERKSSESVRDVGALGSVRARTWFTGEADAPTAAPVKRYTGNESLSAEVSTPWLSVPLINGAAYDECDETTSLEPIGGLFIPLYVQRTLRREYMIEYADCDVEALKNALEAQSMQKAYENIPENAEIVDKWTDFSMIESDDILHARTVIEVETEIAVTRGYMEEN